MAASVSNPGDIRFVERGPYMSYDLLPEGYVRLLKIHEIISHFEEEIEISLISVPLAECPPYVALSYTWAEPEPFVDPTTIIFTKVPRCYPIKCGGRLILGTRNLRDALRRLRQYERIQKYEPPDSALGKMAIQMASYNKNIHTYWIDAICINQEDLQERSTQVLLMGRIYQQAQCTMVWLGEQDAYTVPAVEVLLKIVGDQISQNSFVNVGNSTTTKSKFEGIDTLDDNEIKALAMLMARKWISRTWALQEVVLSPSVLTLWGGVFFPFHVLLRVAVTLSISRSTLRLSSRLSTRYSEFEEKGGILQRIRGVTTLGMIHSSRLSFQQDQKPSFMNTISMCRYSESTDPRDNVYGILGMAAEFGLSSERTYKPDYTQVVAEVYIEATAFVTKTRGDLACLTLVCDSSLKKITGLPSWCPDYSAPLPPLKEFSDVTRRWQLGLSWSDARIPEILETSKLRVDGSLFDVIVEASTLLKGGPDSPMNHGLSAVFSLATRLEDREASTSATRQRHGPFETLWRTLMLDEFDYKAPAPATAAFLVPAFIPGLLCTMYMIGKQEPSEVGGSNTWILATKESVFEELRRLESIVNQLEGVNYHSCPGLPNIDRMRKWIDRCSLQLSSDASYGRDSIEQGLMLASAEETSLSNQVQDIEGWTAIHLPGSGRTIVDSDLYQMVELVQRHFISPFTDGRLKRVYFRTRNTLGTGQPSVRVGDEIWFLHGATAPVILRPLASGNYRFMGEAYVHGVMYGEIGEECKTHKLIIIE